PTHACPIPAYWACGEGRTGGIGHAWVGWVMREPSGEYKMTDYGRYKEDSFYTATIVHPRSGEVLLDYIVGLEAHGLSDEKHYDEADLLYHIFEEVGAYLDPKPRYDLLIE